MSINPLDVSSKHVEVIYKKPPASIFFGLETSGKLHLGHYSLLKAVKRVSLKKNLPITIYLADYHAKLNEKKDVDHYCAKTQQFMTLFFKDKANLVISSTNIAEPNYTKCFQQFMHQVTVTTAMKGLPDDLKMKHKDALEKGYSIRLKYLLYPLYQAIDPHYFNCDTVFCGLDQRKVYALAYDVYEKLGWPKFNLIMYPLITKDFKIGAYEKKMSSSDQKSIFIDKSLYELLYAHKNQSQKLTKEQLSVLKKLSSVTDPDVLEIYGVETNEEFLDQLLNDVAFLKTFAWD